MSTSNKNNFDQELAANNPASPPGQEPGDSERGHGQGEHWEPSQPGTGHGPAVGGPEDDWREGDDASGPIRPSQAVRKRFVPFPTEVLPDPLKAFVAAGAEAIQCDPSFIAMPLLTAVAAAIGITRSVQLKQSWVVPPMLWTAIVGESGTTKTPAFRLAMRPLRDRQQKTLRRHDEAMLEYEETLASYERELNGLETWKGRYASPEEA